MKEFLKYYKNTIKILDIYRRYAMMNGSTGLKLTSPDPGFNKQISQNSDVIYF